MTFISFFKSWVRKKPNKLDIDFVLRSFDCLSLTKDDERKLITHFERIAHNGGIPIECISDLRRNLESRYRFPVKEKDKEKVLRIIKKDFKVNNGISFYDFINVYNDIVEKTPEELI